MKKYLYILLFLGSFTGFAQENYIVKTEDGRRVLLKADFTWEYIDLEKPKGDTLNAALLDESKTINASNCNLSSGYKEPKLNSKIQSELRKGRATIKHVKKKVAKDYNCSVDEVILLSAREQKEKAIYDFCANGTKVSYKRIGNTIIKNGSFF